MQEILSRHWHALPESEVLALLESDAERGLDAFEAEHRQTRFGPNILTERKGKSAVTRFLLQFHQPLVYILLVASGVTAFLHEWVDAGIIFAVVLLNAFVGFVQESKALKAIAALSRSMSRTAAVIRSGQSMRLGAEGLVPGDIVTFQSGDKIPADIRLLESRELQVDESALTGESVPVRKNPGVLPRETLLTERTNIVYSSTLVTYGQGRGVVVATADATEIGRISELLATTEVLATPLTRKITHFSHVLLFVVLGLAALTFLVGFFRGESWLDLFMAAVSLAVGAIPEGLPAALTIILAMGVSRMAQRNAIVRQLPAVETLGSTTVICTDKTGTLTKNQMTVQAIFVGTEEFGVSGIGYEPKGEFRRGNARIDPREDEALLECLHAGLLCNDAQVAATAEGWRVEGDPTEGALIVAALKAGLSQDALQQERARIDTIPFESEHQYMATLHDVGPGPRIVYLKGSVESILARCDTCAAESGSGSPLDADRVQAAAANLAKRGLRVLAFARAELPAETKKIERTDLSRGVHFLGLQAMLDPPRDEVTTALRTCQGAGIDVKMITGDHASTASAIAAQIGLCARATGEIRALTGPEMATFSDAQLIEQAAQTCVFARVTPEQKLRLVEALQARSGVVAMTGDGVNDAPALRRADIGIAMGITGTEVAKEAADVVLTDDNFATIEAAVEEGRGVFDNLTKFIVWTLPTNLGEGLVILAAILAGIALPILPVQILWINMTTAILLGMMLAFEPKEANLMKRAPRNPKASLLSRMLSVRILLVSGLLLLTAFGMFEWSLHSGVSLETARTVAVNVFVLVELFYLFNCRSLTRPVHRLGWLSNPWVIIGSGSMLVLQMLFTYAPWMNRIFHSSPIGWKEWAWIIGAAWITSLLVELEKAMSRRRSKARRQAVAH